MQVDAAQEEVRPGRRAAGCARDKDERCRSVVQKARIGRLPAFASTSMTPNASKRRQWGLNGENHCGIMTLNSLNQNKKLRCFLPAL